MIRQSKQRVPRAQLQQGDPVQMPLQKGGLQQELPVELQQPLSQGTLQLLLPLPAYPVQKNAPLWVLSCTQRNPEGHSSSAPSALHFM